MEKYGPYLTVFCLIGLFQVLKVQNELEFLPSRSLQEIGHMIGRFGEKGVGEDTWRHAILWTLRLSI